MTLDIKEYNESMLRIKVDTLSAEVKHHDKLVDLLLDVAHTAQPYRGILIDEDSYGQRKDLEQSLRDVEEYLKEFHK